MTVRRARAEDREAVLGFASATWDGWDYIPHAWPVWLEATDGVLLVVAAAEPGDGSAPRDREGRPLPAGQPVAVARVAMLSPTEAWVEGIRVDPRVRGMDVATNLQVAELQWAAAQGANVVRYATGAGNEASHRLGARHGFELLAAFRTYRWSETDDEKLHHDDKSAFVPEIREAASAVRRAVLSRLDAEGLVARLDDADRWWPRVAADATFLAGRRLYERRGWTLQELSESAFRAHLSRGEVIVAGDTTWALAILERQAQPSEDASLHLALLCGEGATALELASTVRRAAGNSLRFRLAADEPALLRGREHAFAEAGFRAGGSLLHILARPIDDAHSPPQPADPSLLSIANS
jgi:GNAT superfamily N-acetyltransferase